MTSEHDERIHYLITNAWIFLYFLFSLIDEYEARDLLGQMLSVNPTER